MGTASFLSTTRKKKKKKSAVWNLTGTPPDPLRLEHTAELSTRAMRILRTDMQLLFQAIFRLHFPVGLASRYCCSVSEMWPSSEHDTTLCTVCNVRRHYCRGCLTVCVCLSSLVQAHCLSLVGARHRPSRLRVYPLSLRCPRSISSPVTASDLRPAESCRPRLPRGMGCEKPRDKCRKDISAALSLISVSTTTRSTRC